MYLNSSAVLFSVKELILLHMQLSPPWTANTTSTTRYNFSVCTQMNYLMYEWKLQAARQRQSPSKTFYGLGIVPFSDLFFTGVGLVKGVIKLALNGTQLLFATFKLRRVSSRFSGYLYLQFFS